MTAPIFYIPEIYKLNTEIKQGADGLYYLREEKEYAYDDVWKARNSYEEFFRKLNNDLYDVVELEPEDHYYDKWINMIGDEKRMLVKKVYIHQFDSLKDAQEKEAVLITGLEETIKEYNKFKRKDNIEEELLPFLERNTEEKDITNKSFEELGMSILSRRVLAKMGITSFKTLKEFYEKKSRPAFRNIGRIQLERSIDELEEIARRNNFYDELEKMRQIE